MTEKVGEGKFALPENVYDVAKDVAQIYLPAAGTLYFTLAAIWGLPGAEQVVGTVVALGTFMGVCLKISKISFDNSDKGKDGTLLIDTSGPKDIYRFDTSTPLDEIADKKTITFKVEPNAQVSTMDPRLLDNGSQ